VNEIFNPERTAKFFDEPAEIRSKINMSNRNTNYGVVRPELLERIYETLYHQRLRHESEEEWPHRILPNRAVRRVDTLSPEKVHLDTEWNACNTLSAVKLQGFDYDLVVLATGYRHNGHEEILASLKSASGKGVKDWTVGKNYRLSIGGLNVSRHAGIWLQGCNEKTHGVSSSSILLDICETVLTVVDVQLADTLLSGLAVRGGEIVKSIFGNDADSPELSNGVHP
jgi:L-ornithine N5-monooxygenase